MSPRALLNDIDVDRSPRGVGASERARTSPFLDL